MGTPVLDLFVIGSIIEASWILGSCRFGAEDHFDRPIERVVEIESNVLIFQLLDMISLDELLQASKDLLQDRFIAYFEIPSVARLARFLAFAFSSEHLSDLKCLIQMFYEGIESTRCLWRYVDFQASADVVRVSDLGFDLYFDTLRRRRLFGNASVSWCRSNCWQLSMGALAAF